MIARWHRRLVALTAILAVLLSMPLRSQAVVWFAEEFETPGSGEYGFGLRYEDRINQSYSYDHMATGDYDGSGAAHLVRFAGHDQYTFGYTVVNTNMGKTMWSIGDHYYARYRVRFDDDYRWTSATSGCVSSTDTPPWGGGACVTNGQNKFWQMGSTGDYNIDQSRVIVMNQKPGGPHCGLGSSQGNPGVGTAPSDFGLSGSSWSDSEHAGKYGGLAPGTNTGAQTEGCLGPGLLTYGNNTPVAPGPNSAPPVNGWYHVQLYVKSGLDGTAEYKLWINNNDFNNPTYTRTGFSLAVVGWEHGFNIGGQTTGPLAADAGLRIGAAEIGDSFDAEWCGDCDEDPDPEPGPPGTPSYRLPLPFRLGPAGA